MSVCTGFDGEESKGSESHEGPDAKSPPAPLKDSILSLSSLCARDASPSTGDLQPAITDQTLHHAGFVISTHSCYGELCTLLRALTSRESGRRWGEGVRQKDRFDVQDNDPC